MTYVFAVKVGHCVADLEELDLGSLFRKSTHGLVHDHLAAKLSSLRLGENNYKFAGLNLLTYSITMTR